MTVVRPYAGAESLYVEASRRAPDASRVVFFVRAALEPGCTPDELAARAPEAIRRVQARHPMLRVALGPDGFVRSDAPIPFELVTSDDPHAAAIPQLKEEWRIPAKTSPFGVRLVLPTHAPDEKSQSAVPITLLVRGHHAACDGFSLVGLAAEVLRSLCDPKSLPLGSFDDPPDVLTVARRELGSPWRRPSLLARAALALVRRGRAVRGPVVQLAPPETAATPPVRCLELQLAADETDRIRARCREHGVGITPFLLAATALACEAEGRIDLGVAVDLRRRAKATALPVSTLGFYGAMTDVALAVAPESTVWTLAADAAASLKARLEDTPELPFATALAVAPLLPLARRVVAAGRSVFPQTLLVSNVGECGSVFDGIAGAAVQSAGFASSPRASRKLHVSCTSVRGTLSICLAWPEGALTAARVERFATTLRRALSTVVPGEPR